MPTPYLGLDNSALNTEKFNIKRMNDNTAKIETALYNKRADLPDRVQIGSDWFTLASSNKDWEIYSEDASGNKVVRHGIWAMVELQFKAKRAINVGANGNVTNTHLITLEKGYRPKALIGITGINSNLDMVLELNPNGNGYITAYNHTSTTIAKDTIVRVGGRYIYVP